MTNGVGRRTMGDERSGRGPWESLHRNLELTLRVPTTNLSHVSNPHQGLSTLCFFFFKWSLSRNQSAHCLSLLGLVPIWGNKPRKWGKGWLEVKKWDAAGRPSVLAACSTWASSRYAVGWASQEACWASGLEVQQSFHAWGKLSSRVDLWGFWCQCLAGTDLWAALRSASTGLVDIVCASGNWRQEGAGVVNER